MTAEVDLFAIRRGSVTAPAGCGKTHLIATSLLRHEDKKPVLILTHTNAGVIALRTRLTHLGVPASAYRVLTMDGCGDEANLDISGTQWPKSERPPYQQSVD